MKRLFWFSGFFVNIANGFNRWERNTFPHFHSTVKTVGYAQYNYIHFK